MRIELSDVDEMEVISFLESLACVDGLTRAQTEQINSAVLEHFDKNIQIDRHGDDGDWLVWL